MIHVKSRPPLAHNIMAALRSGTRGSCTKGAQIKEADVTTIREICKHEVACVMREATVQTAAKLMRHYHVGTLVVVDSMEGRRLPVGIITDRDIVIEVSAVDLDAKCSRSGSSGCRWSTRPVI